MIDARQEGGSAQDPSEKTMAPWTFDEVSSWHSAYLWVIDLCRRGRRRPKDVVHRSGTRAPGSGFIISIRRFLLKIGSLCRVYIRTVKIVQDIPVVTSIIRPLAGASSSSSSASTPDPNLSDNYPEIGASACGEPAVSNHLIYMVTRMEIGRTTAPADIPPSEDQRRLMLGHRAVA
jgi:hypothetical protein